MEDTQEKRWLCVDASQSGKMRFAAVEPSTTPRIGQVTTIETEGLPTFTDALQKYERECGFKLDGADCALAMAGPTNGEMLTMVRSRWTVTRGGMQAVFGRPATIINDVAARAWAARASGLVPMPVRGTTPLSLHRPSRKMMLLVEEGVGGAIVDIDRNGHMRVMETEVGHSDFAPSTEREEALAKRLKGMDPHVSWEKMLTLPPGDPAWKEAIPGLTDSERQSMQAAMMGRFIVNLAHAYGAWQGCMLTGDQANKLLSMGGKTAFEGAFAQKRNFSRLVLGVPVWRIDQRDAVLLGAAEALAHREQVASGGSSTISGAAR